MPHTSRIGSPTTEDDDPPTETRFPHHKKLMVSGLAIATLGAVALVPVGHDKVQTARADAELTGISESLEAYPGLIQETLETLFVDRAANPPTRPNDQPALTTVTAEAFAELAKSLADPDAQARLGSFFTNTLNDPSRVPNAIAAAPGKYGPGIQAAFSAAGETNQTAFQGLYSERHARNRSGRPLYEWVDADGEKQILNYDPNNDRYFLGENGTEQVHPNKEDLTEIRKPGVFQEFLRILAEGDQVKANDDPNDESTVDARFVSAFSEFNMWLLIDVLGDTRADGLGIVRYPGDFLEDLGFESLGRILGTSWMDENANARPGWANAGLLSRGRLGNAARALIAPQIGGIYRTMMVLDTVNNALKVGDVETAVGEVIAAPANITNVLLNGFQMLHNGKYEEMPGFFSPRSTFNFILNEVPTDIANVLTMKKPAPSTTTAADADAEAAAAPTAEAATPSSSATPEASATSTPSTPSVPSVDAPAPTPSAPVIPSAPESPVVPEVPAAPAAPEVPAAPETPAVTGEATPVE